METREIAIRNDLGLISRRIVSIRGTQVILDRDLADLYGVKTGELNQAVGRNLERFPDDFMFSLEKEEMEKWKSQFVISNSLKMGLRKPPRAFTEQGVAMLSGLLRSKQAIEVNIMIMRAFVAMRRIMQTNEQIIQRLDCVEYQQIESEHKIEQLFQRLEEQSIKPKQGIFFDGQVFDAYVFAIGLIEKAEKRIVLIDNYIDETVLVMLDKRKPGVISTIYTKTIDEKIKLDIEKHNAQYASIVIKTFCKSHDRFLIIDEMVYHIGASLKDLGKKWFAFSLLRDSTPDELLKKI